MNPTLRRLVFIFIPLQVLEIRPRSVHQLPVGARVCTVWSSAYICLFPGTIVTADTEDVAMADNQVLVELDDGDSRLVEVEKIRMLPPDYSRVGNIRRKNTLNWNFSSIY